MIADHKDDREKEKIISRVQHFSQTDTPENGNYGGSGGGQANKLIKIRATKFMFYFGKNYGSKSVYTCFCYDLYNL